MIQLFLWAISQYVSLKSQYQPFFQDFIDVLEFFFSKKICIPSGIELPNKVVSSALKI